MKKVIVLLVMALATGQLFAQATKPGTLDELLKKLERIEVNADGSITVKGKPLKNIKLNQSKTIYCDIITNEVIDSLTNVIRLNCRDYIADYNTTLNQGIIPAMAYMDRRDYINQYVTTLLPHTPATITAKINEVDDYGDQVPHFSTKQPAGTFVSTSFERNVAEAVMRQP